MPAVALECPPEHVQQARRGARSPREAADSTCPGTGSHSIVGPRPPRPGYLGPHEDALHRRRDRHRPGPQRPRAHRRRQARPRDCRCPRGWAGRAATAPTRSSCSRSATRPASPTRCAASRRRAGDESAVEGATVTARVGIGAIGGGRFGLEVTLDVKVPRGQSGRRGGARRGRPRALPVLQRHPRQRRRRPRRQRRDAVGALRPRGRGAWCSPSPRAARRTAAGSRGRPALVPVPDRRLPPNGWRPTIAPVIERFT